MTNFEIEVGGKTFAFNVGVIFLGQYIQKKKTDLDSLFKEVQKNPFFIIPDLMYESAKYKNPKIKESKSEFFDLIDKDGIQAKSINSFLEKFTLSLVDNVPVEEVEEVEEDAKKK